MGEEQEGKDEGAGEGAAAPERSKSSPGIYRTPLPIDPAKLASDDPLRNPVASDTAAFTAVEEAGKAASGIANDPALSPAGRVMKLREAHEQLQQKYFAPFDPALDTLERKLAGDRTTLLTGLLKQCSPDPVVAAESVKFLRSLSSAERKATLLRVASRADGITSVAAAIGADPVYELLDDAFKDRLSEMLLEARGGTEYQELKQREQVLAVVRSNRESAERALKAQLLGDAIPWDESSIRSRLRHHGE